MAKVKTTRRDTYAKALAGYGYTLDEVKIIAYEFPTLASLKEFHFALIAKPRVGIIFFDSIENSVAQCAVKNGDNDTIGRLEYYASQCGGKKTIPNLI